MSATLYSLSVSPPALAARCMLEYKGIDHRVVELVPGTPPVALRVLRFRGHTVVPPLPGPVPSVLPRAWLEPFDAAHRRFSTPDTVAGGAA